MFRVVLTPMQLRPLPLCLLHLDQITSTVAGGGLKALLTSTAQRRGLRCCACLRFCACSATDLRREVSRRSILAAYYIALHARRSDDGSRLPLGSRCRRSCTSRRVTGGGRTRPSPRTPPRTISRSQTHRREAEFVGLQTLPGLFVRPIAFLRELRPP